VGLLHRDLAIAILGVVVSATTVYADDDVQVRRMSFVESGQQLLVSASFTEIFDARAYQRLASGIPTTVLVRGTVVLKDSELPVSLTVGSYRVAYDLWDEVYTIQIDDPEGSRVVRLRRRADVLATVGRVSRFPISALDRLSRGPHYHLALIVELNPVSEELLAEVRRWLSKPAGRGRLDVSSSMFGSFVSVFVNPKLAQAERVLRFRSQAFYRTEP
jgi:hypothetical protein